MSQDPTHKTPIRFESETSHPFMPEVKEVSPEEVATLVASGTSSIRLIDVRTEDEYTGELGHIAGAELIVLDTLPERIDSFADGETIVFVCRSGARSARATLFALENGFERAYNLKGGMILWNQLGLPTAK